MPVATYLGLILAVLSAAGLTVAAFVWSGWSLAVLSVLALCAAHLLRRGWR